MKDKLIGIKSAAPIVLGYLPIGFAYGVLGSKSGLSIFDVTIFSLMCYAGSAQFIGVSLWAMNTNPVTMILTIFIVNLRHLLYSTSLSQYFKNIKFCKIPFLSFFITDETYAVSVTDIARGVKPEDDYFFGLFLTSYISWAAASFLGAFIGSRLGGKVSLGLDFALPAMYIALLLMQLNDLKKVSMAVLSGALSLILYFAVPGNLNVIIAAVLCSIIGVLVFK